MDINIFFARAPFVKNSWLWMCRNHSVSDDQLQLRQNQKLGTVQLGPLT